MPIDTIITGITSVGFPIIMCLLMGWYIKDTTEKHKEETLSFTDALNKNTLVLQKLCDSIGVEREDINEL